MAVIKSNGLEYKDVDPTNNHTERMLRHTVLKRRISQQHRCTAAQRSYAIINLHDFKAKRAKLHGKIKNRRGRQNQRLGKILKCYFLSKAYKNRKEYRL